MVAIIGGFMLKSDFEEIKRTGRKSETKMKFGRIGTKHKIDNFTDLIISDYSRK